MPQTPNSGGASYLGPAGFLDRYSISSVGDLVVDDPSPDANLPPATYAQLTADPTNNDYARRLVLALQTASGEVEAALLRADRYSPADLLSLQGNSLAYLQGIIAPIVFELLRRRRGDTGYKPMPEYDEAMKKLDRLANGSDTLAFVEAEAAGTAQVITLSPADISRANPTTAKNPRLFGLRQWERSAGYGGRSGYDCE